MHKLVIDTNVIVSYCISPMGYSYKLMSKIVLKRKAQIFTSPEIMHEYADLLSRTRFSIKFPDFRNTAENTFIFYSLFAEYLYPIEKLNILSDDSDNKFLELAMEAQADYLITGNSNDFIMQEFAGIKIVSPRQYWIRFGDVIESDNE